MDLSSCKVLSEADDSYHVSFPSGKSFTLPKKGLSDKSHSILKKMQGAEKPEKLFDGGHPTDTTQTDQTPAQMSAALQGGQPITVAPDVAETAPAPAAAPTPQQTMSTNSNGELTPSLPSGAPLSSNPLVAKTQSTEQLLGKEQSELENQQKLQDKEGKAEAKAIGEYLTNPATSTTGNDIVARNAQADANLQKQFADKTLDPNRFFNNQSTGSRIAGSIALILGGFGSGVTGQPNAALSIMNNAIDRDMEAQRNDQSKAMNLWKMNREGTQDDMKANLMTQNQLWTATQAKIGQALATAKGPMAASNLQQMINQIEEKKIQNRAQMGLFQQSMGGANGAPSQMDPAVMVNQVVPEAQRTKAMDDVAKLQYLQKNKQSIIDLFDKVHDENTAGGRIGHAGFNVPSYNQFKVAIMPLIKDEQGKPDEFKQKQFLDLLSGPFTKETEDEYGQTSNEANREALIKQLSAENQAPTLVGNGINPENFATTRTQTLNSLPQKDMYRIWAEANPNTPVGSAYLRKHGK